MTTEKTPKNQYLGNEEDNIGTTQGQHGDSLGADGPVKETSTKHKPINDLGTRKGQLRDVYCNFWKKHLTYFRGSISNIKVLVAYAVLMLLFQQEALV